MKVYVVEEGGVYDPATFVGVYATPDQAEAYVETQRRGREKRISGNKVWFNNTFYEITEHEIHLG